MSQPEHPKQTSQDTPSFTRQQAIDEILRLRQVLRQNGISVPAPDWLQRILDEPNRLESEKRTQPLDRRSAPQPAPAPSDQPELTNSDKTVRPARQDHASQPRIPKPSLQEQKPESAPPLPTLLDWARLMHRRFMGREDRYYLRSRFGRFYQPCTSRYTQACPQINTSGPIRCKGCTARTMNPLNDQDYAGHLGEKRALAITPVTKEGKVNFALLDFEYEKKDELEQLSRYARKQGFESVMDILKREEGKRARLWLFFALPIDVTRAASFMTSFLLNAFADGALQDLSAFDNVFPRPFTSSQEGNCRMIELPFYNVFHIQNVVEENRKMGKSLNPHEMDDIYPDPLPLYETLFNLSPITPDQISEQIRIARALHRHALFEGEPKTEPDQTEQPVLFETREEDPGQFASLKDAGPIRVIKKGRIWIESDPLPASVQSQIIALGSYWNPAYQKKNNRYADGNRIISLAQQETDEQGNHWITLPRHLFDALLFRLDQAQAKIELIDEQTAGTAVPMQFTGELRPEQVPLQSSLLKAGCGILEAATGAGKTVIGASLIAAEQASALVLVASKEILHGWVKALNGFLRFEDPEAENWKEPSKNYPGKIGVLQASTNTLTGRVDIAMVPSLAAKKNLEEMLSGYGVVLVDECHHAGSPTFQRVLNAVKARHVYGFSATPQRTDGLSKSMFWQLGEIAASFSSKEQMENQSFFRLVVPRFTPFVSSDPACEDFTRLVQEAAAHPARNEMIVRDIKEALDNGRTVLVLTRFVEHAHALSRLLGPLPDTECFVYAGDPVKKAENTARLQELGSLPKDKRPRVLLIGTYASISEGFDYPWLDTLLLALPVRAQITISQSIGRIHRQTEGKQVAIVYDYADVQETMLERMYQARLQEYRKQGYQIGEPLLEGESDGQNSSARIYEDDSYQADCFRDLEQAKSRIALCARRLEGGQFETLLHAVQKPLRSRVRIDIFLEEVSQEQQRQLAQAGLHLHIHPRITASCMIIDQVLIWYGNVFSIAAGQGGMLRMASVRDAKELLDARRREEIRLIKEQAAKRQAFVSQN